MREGLVLDGESSQSTQPMLRLDFSPGEYGNFGGRAHTLGIMVHEWRYDREVGLRYEYLI
jgi:hypothetical protein